ncbi:hypothetical protein B0G73_11240 [Paraburkholderia sp. BL25I1N1]|nr:hypothetical protein B0G73_11240 [Paraburkholderia sp. BL25I1N1]
MSSGLSVNYQIASLWTFGVSVTGAGVGSHYGRPVLPVAGAADAKASLIVLNTNPTITYKPLRNLSIGASLVIGFEQLWLNGILAPALPHYRFLAFRVVDSPSLFHFNTSAALAA